MPTLAETRSEGDCNLDEVEELYGTDELMLVNIVADHDAQHRS